MEHLYTCQNSLNVIIGAQTTTPQLANTHLWSTYIQAEIMYPFSVIYAISFSMFVSGLKSHDAVQSHVSIAGHKGPFGPSSMLEVRIVGSSYALAMSISARTFDLNASAL
jgi:hypothetical protein